MKVICKIVTGQVNESVVSILSQIFFDKEKADRSRRSMLMFYYHYLSKSNVRSV